MRVVYREEPCKSALNRVKGMPFDWSLNPSMGCVHRCTFCYVRTFEATADRPSGAAYGRSIRVKTNIGDVLRRELSRTAWRNQPVALGTATDPYQPGEARYRLTRACIEALADSGTPFSIITRGPLIRRDVDVLTDAARRVALHISISVPTLDRDIWRNTEPGTAPPARRLETVSVLTEAGLDVGVAIAPILPGLSDDPRLLADTVRAARAAGARSIWASHVHLRPGTREHFLDSLARDWPELLPRYEQLFAGRAYLPATETRTTSELVRALARTHAAPHRPVLRPPAQPEQLALI
jgi:DNA repair photolyase